MKKSIITMMLALVAMTGQAQVKCHVEGTLETDAWGDEIIICENGTDLRVVDNPRFHVKAKDGRFAYDIETDFPKLYNIFFLKQYETGRLFLGKFIAENCHVNVTMYEDQKPCIVVNGEEGCKHPMLYKLYDVLDAIQILKHSEAYAEATYHLQPGKPYIDYTVRNNDGQLVPISTLTKGKVTSGMAQKWDWQCRRCHVPDRPQRHYPLHLY